MPREIELAVDERLQLNAGGWVTKDAHGTYTAFGADAQVKGRSSDLRRAVKLAGGQVSEVRAALQEAKEAEEAAEEAEPDELVADAPDEDEPEAAAEAAPPPKVERPDDSAILAELEALLEQARQQHEQPSRDELAISGSEQAAGGDAVSPAAPPQPPGAEIVEAPPSNGARIEFNAAIDRWFIHDHNDKPVAFRKSREEADAFAASLPPRPPDRLRPKPPPISNFPPQTFKELRPGGHRTPSVLPRPSRR